MTGPTVPAAGYTGGDLPRPVIAALQKQRQRDPEEILLDGAKLREFTIQDAQDIKDVSEGAYLLSMNQCKIRDLSHLPYLPAIEVLEIQDNHLTDESHLELIAERTPNVTELLLSGNHITNIQSLAFILKLPKLENLELQQNPLTGVSNYRQLLFAECANLQRIDDISREGIKADSDQEDVDADEIDINEAERNLSAEEQAERETRRRALADFYEKDIDDDDDDDDDFDDGEEESEDVEMEGTYSNSHSHSIEE